MAVILFLRFVLFRKRLNLRRAEFDRPGLKWSDLPGLTIQWNAIGLCYISSRVHLHQDYIFDFTRCVDLHGEAENAIKDAKAVDLKGKLLLMQLSKRPLNVMPWGVAGSASIKSNWHRANGEGETERFVFLMKNREP